MPQFIKRINDKISVVKVNQKILSFVKKDASGILDEALVALQSELAASAVARRVQRLHCIVLVARGHSTCDVAAAFGCDVRSVQRWLHQFKKNGAAHQDEKVRTGRPALLTEDQRRLVDAWLLDASSAMGLLAWTGTHLRNEVLRLFGIELSVRHCQRLIAATCRSHAAPHESAATKN